MLPFSRFFLGTGVAIGAVATLFISLPVSDQSVAQLSPLEREQLRNEIRHGHPRRGDTPAVADESVAPTVSSGAFGFKSGLTVEERQALREQVRGVNPNLLLDESAISESVAVNESYPDGVSAPMIDRGGYAGPNR